MSVQECIVISIPEDRDQTPETSCPDRDQDDFEVVGMASPLSPFRSQRGHITVKGDETCQKKLTETQSHIQSSIDLTGGPTEEGPEKLLFEANNKKDTAAGELIFGGIEFERNSRHAPSRFDLKMLPAFSICNCLCLTKESQDYYNETGATGLKVSRTTCSHQSRRLTLQVQSRRKSRREQAAAPRVRSR